MLDFKIVLDRNEDESIRRTKFGGYIRFQLRLKDSEGVNQIFIDGFRLMNGRVVPPTTTNSYGKGNIQVVTLSDDLERAITTKIKELLSAEKGG